MVAKDVFGSRTTSFRAAIAAAAFAAAAMPVQARSLVHYFDFDTPSGSGLAYAGVDRGTSPADFTLKGSSVPRTAGAMGSDYAYYASAANTALWQGRWPVRGMRLHDPRALTRTLNHGMDEGGSK